MTTTCGGALEAYVVDRDSLDRQFEFQSRNNGYHQMNSTGKGMKPFIQSELWVIQ